MATLTIKNLPDSLYAQLKARASQNRRSINSEAILAVERALIVPTTTETEKLLAKLRDSRSRLTHMHLTDADLAAARADGRS